MIRKFILTSAILLVEEKSLAQLVSALITITVFLVAHTSYSPFLTSSSNLLQSLCMISVFVTLVFSIMSRNATEMGKVGVIQPIDIPSGWWVIAAVGLTVLYTGYLVLCAIAKMWVERSEARAIVGSGKGEL